MRERENGLVKNRKMCSFAMSYLFESVLTFVYNDHFRRWVTRVYLAEGFEVLEFQVFGDIELEGVVG